MDAAVTVLDEAARVDTRAKPAVEGETGPAVRVLVCSAETDFGQAKVISALDRCCSAAVCNVK